MRPPSLSPIQAHALHFKNPFVLLPEATPLTFPNGRVTPEILMYYKGLAQSEAALLICGPATVAPPPNRKYSLLRADQPKYIDGMRALAKLIQTNGCIPGLQLTHLAQVDAKAFMERRRMLEQYSQEDFPDEKILTAYGNAIGRATGNGFRYIELSACDGLLLDYLIREDREALLRQLFEGCVAAARAGASEELPNCIGMRLAPGQAHRAKYANLFLEAGGHLIACEGAAASELGLVLDRCQQMGTITRFSEPAELKLQLREQFLLGLKPRMKNKAYQVQAYFELGT